MGWFRRCVHRRGEFLKNDVKELLKGNTQGIRGSVHEFISELFNDDGSMFAAHSAHPGGVNMAFLDGSVKFMKDSVSPATYGAIGTAMGGEVIDASSY